ncbi:MAG TPA: AsmA-like C-terminal region-containing protein, partial [Magnetospirillaceae bacterium]|nr:AsmA-like C-terminal region-containing protein [Magnetospirillaceae bacterium]
ITLDGVRIKADSSQIDLSAAIRPGPRPSFGVTFTVDQLNADAYRPSKAPVAPPPASAGPVPADLPPPPPVPAKSQDFGIDAEIHGKVGRLAWHGLTAQDLALDIALSPDGALVRSVTVADLAGAQASFSGTLSRAAEGLRLDHGKAAVHSHDIARTARMLGAEIPFEGQADISADISGPLASPALVLTAPVLNAGKIWFDHVSVDLALPPGKLAFDHLTAGLYGGQLTGRVLLARDGGASSLQLALAGAQMKKALLEAADLGLADGEMSGEANLTTTGPSDAEIKANLAGTMSLAVKNGQIKGFDLKAANDKLNGKDGIGGLLALLSAGLTGGETHFSSLTATAKADHGVIESHDIALIAEGGDAKGVATVNLPADTIDSHVDFHFANAHDAPPLTMRVQGSLKSPHRYLDVKPLQQWLSEHGMKTGKPKDVLKGLLQGLVK